MKKFDYRSLYKLLRMVVVLVLLYRPLGFDSLTASECCEKIAVTDMAGRTVYVPKEVTKVLAAGHCATITATFAPEKVAGGLARSDMQKALLPESWWAEPAPAPTAPPANPQQPAPDKKAMFGNDSVRIARTKAQVEKYNANLIIQELTAGAVERAEKMQAATGVPVVLVDLSIPRYKEAFALLGKCLANEEHSAALIDFLTKYIDPIGEKAKTIPDAKRVKVYYAEGKDGLRSEPAGSNHTEVMEYAGAINVADLPKPDMGDHPDGPTIKKIKKWNPDIILTATPGADKLTAYSHIITSKEWKPVTAAKKSSVYQIPMYPFSWFDRPPGANRIIGIVWLANLFYPEIFPLDVSAITKEFFQLFYGMSLSDEQTAQMLMTQPKPIIQITEADTTTGASKLIGKK